MKRKRRFPSLIEKRPYAPYVAVIWSPVNQAWFVTWHGQVLHVADRWGKADDYADFISYSAVPKKALNDPSRRRTKKRAARHLRR